MHFRLQPHNNYLGLFVFFLFALFSLYSEGLQAQQENNTQNIPGTYFRADTVRPQKGNPPDSINLETPQACMEHFIRACRRKRWQSASWAMNFRLLQPINSEQARQQALRLYYLFNQNLWIDWSLLPDRPDGLKTGSMISGATPMAGKPRRSIQLGSISLDGRDIPIQITRVKIGEQSPVWLFSAQTVESIDRLYEVHGPSWLARKAPGWTRGRLLRVPIWQWLALLLLLVVGIVVAWGCVHIFTRRLANYLPLEGESLVRGIHWPLAILLAGLVSYLTSGTLLTLPGEVSAVMSPVMLAILIFSTTWLAIRILTFLTGRILRDDQNEELTIDESGTIARLTVIRYGLVLLIITVGFSILLISLDLFRALGIALLGSAGAAAVILGIAGHAVLGNLIAGVQIALTQPFRIGDTVIIEGYWGRIEELRYTYVTVRTWDEKRLVLPIRYFMENWIENWSKTDTFLVRPIYLKVDYRTDVQAIRKKFIELLNEDELWAEERDDPDVLVTECGEETITIRLACGAKDPSDAWQLSCRVREKLIAWLQQYKRGFYLPRQRIVLFQQEKLPDDSGADEQVKPQPQTPGGGQGSEDGE
jgi:small-conductance mechanosensitive channel